MASPIRTGLKGLPPIPPKMCLPITTETKVPVIINHHGDVAGKSMANKRPIRAALPSPMLMERFVTLFIASSQIIAKEIERATTPTAFMPYWKKPNKTAGSAAIII